MGYYRLILLLLLICYPTAHSMPSGGELFTPSAIGKTGSIHNAARDSVTTFDTGRPMSVGLVLSGGGAKGIAHIGVIKALEENDIPIDYIAGTSMGAIIGGLYSMGWTTDEMLDLILSPEFTYWSTGVFDPAKVYYFSRSESTPAMFNFSIGPKGSKEADSIPASVISPMPMNFGFMDIFSAYTAQCRGNFDSLFVPFRCVASDTGAGHKVVFSKGSLGDAVRASMSFPIVFQPTTVDGVMLYDGGIFDNFPVDVMTRDFSPDIMIGVDVSTPATTPQVSLMDQIENLVMRRQDYALDPRLGIKIKIDLHQFALLDFPKARQISAIGYDKAMSMMDSIKSRVTSRISPVTRRTSRSAFRSATPYLRFDSVKVSGGSPRQNEYISYLFDPDPERRDTFDIVHARQSYYRAISPGRLRDLQLKARYNDSTELFSLDVRMSVKRNLNLAIGGYITSSQNSYLYAGTGYNTLSFSSVSTALGLWLGQSYMGAQADAGITLHTRHPSALTLQMVAHRQRFVQNDNLFYELNEPTYLIDHEFFGNLAFETSAGWRGKVAIGAGFGHLKDSFYRSNSLIGSGRDHTQMNLGKAFVRYTSNTLDNDQFPTKGASYNICAMGLLGNYKFRPSNQSLGSPGDSPLAGVSKRVRWMQAEARTRNYFDISSRFSLGVETDIMLSTRRLESTFNASIVTAPAYKPTNASNNIFNPSLRANSFIAAGIVPVYKFSQQFTARIMADCFMPLRKIKQGPDLSACYGRWFSNPEFFSELDLSYSFSFATLSGYVNYVSSGPRNWNCGLTLGIFLLAPRFLR